MRQVLQWRHHLLLLLLYSDHRRLRRHDRDELSNNRKEEDEPLKEINNSSSSSNRQTTNTDEHVIELQQLEPTNKPRRNNLLSFFIAKKGRIIASRGREGGLPAFCIHLFMCACVCIARLKRICTVQYSEGGAQLVTAAAAAVIASRPYVSDESQTVGAAPLHCEQQQKKK